MRKKSEFTILERAMQTVPYFEKVYHKMKQQTILGRLHAGSFRPHEVLFIIASGYSNLKSTNS